MVLWEQVITKGVVSCMYTTKSACNVLLCLIYGAYRTGTNAPCSKAEEDVGEEGSMVHELLWEVISFLTRWRKKVGCFLLDKSFSVV